MRLRRYTVREPETDFEGSIYACGTACAREAAGAVALVLVSCEGNDGVDEMTTCDGGLCEGS